MTSLQIAHRKKRRKSLKDTEYFSRQLIELILKRILPRHARSTTQGTYGNVLIIQMNDYSYRYEEKEVRHRFVIQ